MQVYLHKILPFLLLPVGLTLMLLLAGLLLRRRALVWLGLAVFWLSSTPILSNFMIRSAENWAERRPVSDMPSADAIVVLSGGRVVAPGAAAVSEWGDINRFFGGVELFKAGRAPLLIFTGGWSPLEPKARPEGELMIEHARTLGVPAKHMLITGPVFNTAEEAQAVAALLSKGSAKASVAGRKPHVLLVTSAFHVPRAQRLFERAGLTVSPFPVDFKVSAGSERGLLEFLPNAGALELTNKAWHEMYGRLYYAMRGLVQ